MLCVCVYEWTWIGWGCVWLCGAVLEITDGVG